MIILDIILALILLWSLYRGFRDGIAVQLGGLAGLFIGVYLAFRFGHIVADWFGIDPAYSNIAGFVIVLVLVIIVVALLGRVLRGLFKLTGLGVLDKAGGIIFSALKTALILGLLLYSFQWLNRQTGWVSERKMETSLFYTPLIKVAEHSFPYIDFVKDKLFEPVDGRQAQ